MFFTFLVKGFIKFIENKIVPMCERLDSKFIKYEVKQIPIVGDSSVKLSDPVCEEPSMDEILSSIRRIVFEDDPEGLKKYEQEAKERKLNPEKNPPMSEILASIRRIIDEPDDDTPPRPPYKISSPPSHKSSVRELDQAGVDRIIERNNEQNLHVLNEDEINSLLGFEKNPEICVCKENPCQCCEYKSKIEYDSTKNEPQEPSMEEILSSMRRIITE